MSARRKPRSLFAPAQGHGAQRERFSVAHLDIDVVSHPEDGTFFGLRARHVPAAAQPPLLASGPVPAQMARELRALAHRLDQLAALQRRASGPQTHIPNERAD